MRKYWKLGIFLFSFVFLFFSFVVQASENDNLNIYFFTSDGCPHCAEMRTYLNTELKELYPQINVEEFEVSTNRNNALFLKEIGQTLHVSIGGVPFLVIGDETFIGYSSVSSPKVITKRVGECYLGDCADSVYNIVNIDKINKSLDKTDNIVGSVADEVDNENLITLPLLGEIDPKTFSLPILTIVMGVLDGFNPCAMWVLLFLISLLLNVKDKKRMWLLGGTFIFASAFVYFLFMAAWLNLIIFLGFIVWVRLGIGALSLGGGIYSLRDFFVNKEAACKVTGEKKRKRTFDKLKKAVYQKNLWLALGGIIILAFAVNLVELFCSAGLPAVYTQILALNEVSTLGKYLYILLYVFFFIIDDLVVFFIAMTTLHITGITTKYSRASRLIGGTLMLIIGLLLIFKPGWLMFG